MTNFETLIKPIVIRTTGVSKDSRARFGYFETWVNNNEIMDGILVSVEKEKFAVEIWKNGELIDKCHQNEWQTDFNDGWDQHIKTEWNQIFEFSASFPLMQWFIYLPYFGHIKIHETKIR